MFALCSLRDRQKVVDAKLRPRGAKDGTARNVNDHARRPDSAQGLSTVDSHALQEPTN
jgi:hypothetical protein